MSEGPKKIRLTAAEMTKLNEILGAPGSKIEAIKHIRSARLHQQEIPTGGRASDVSLREAKDAVEDYMSRRGLETTVSTPLAAVVVPHQPIKRIVCDFGEGDLELDVEGMSLRILSEMGSARIEDITSLLELYKRVRDWENAVTGGERS